MVGALEFRAIFGRVAVRSDAEVTGLFGARLDREHLHRAACSFRKQFLDDLDDNGNKCRARSAPVTPMPGWQLELGIDERTLIIATKRRTPNTSDRKAAVRPSSLPGKKLRIALTSCLSSCGSLGISNFKASAATSPRDNSPIFNRNGIRGNATRSVGNSRWFDGPATFITKLRAALFADIGLEIFRGTSRRWRRSGRCKRPRSRNDGPWADHQGAKHQGGVIRRLDIP